MTNIELRKSAKALINEMSGPRLRLAAEFLAFVQAREIDAATAELLDIPGFDESYARGIRDIRAGRTTPWRAVKTHV